jgi:hypothetical protein
MGDILTFLACPLFFLELFRTSLELLESSLELFGLFRFLLLN